MGEMISSNLQNTNDRLGKISKEMTELTRVYSRPIIRRNKQY